MDFKRSVFLASVVSVLVSGISVFNLSDSNKNDLNTTYNKMVRRLLQGKAAKKDEHGNFKGRTTLEVCQMAKLPTLGTILRMQRLKMLQGWFNDPLHHEVVLSALLGKYVFENEVVTNPWTEMFCEDILQCQFLDDMVDVCEFLKPKYEKNGGVALRDLFQDKELREDFTKFDVHQLKSMEVTGAPCLKLLVGDSFLQLVDHPNRYQCDMVKEDGMVCGKEFNTRRGLKIHQHWMHKQNMDITASCIVQNKQCPFCETWFTHKASAVNHVRSAIQNGVCKPNRNVIPAMPVNEQQKVVCKMCGETINGLDDYNKHLVVHMEIPSVEGKVQVNYPGLHQWVQNRSHSNSSLFDPSSASPVDSSAEIQRIDSGARRCIPEGADFCIEEPVFILSSEDQAQES